MKLTPYFTLQEMILSETAARKGIDNTPSADIINNLQRLAEFLEHVRALVGRPILVTSGYRSPQLNQAIGGAARSSHMSGLAADINAPGLTPLELARSIADSELAFDQLILEFDAWVHIGLATRDPRRQLMTIRRGSGYRAGLVEVGR
ncbi:Peptidase M15 [compost metagenome]